jgi:sugar/nucleoside kinase (ribokinase family)
LKKSYKIAGIGELLWDILPQGKQLGGAPCNFAFHALQAGLKSRVISAIGHDKAGIPDYIMHKNVAWDYIEQNAKLKALVEEISFSTIQKVEVEDTVGAGDSFTAFLLAGILNDLQVKRNNQTATDVASYVCTQQGATPMLPQELIERFKNNI